MRSSSRKNASAGFSLIEILISIALVSALLTAAFTLLLRTQRSLTNVQSNMEGHGDLDNPFAILAADFAKRANLANSVTLLNGQTNQATGCSGLAIIQRYLNPTTNVDNFRLVHAYTACTPGTVFWTSATDLLNLGGWSCPAGTTPNLQISRWNTGAVQTAVPPAGAIASTTFYPAPNAYRRGVIICFSTTRRAPLGANRRAALTMRPLARRDGPLAARM
jgi:prepilin-type N-terminal cleavage/methylation domain-containing protein